MGCLNLADPHRSTFARSNQRCSAGGVGRGYAQPTRVKDGDTDFGDLSLVMLVSLEIDGDKDGIR